MLLRLIEPDSGKIEFDGKNLLALSGEELRRQRRQMQMIFQDPFASLNPRMRVGEIVGEPLAIHEPALPRTERRARVAATLKLRWRAILTNSPGDSGSALGSLAL
jgi:ABC-type microcin C transport system duplicated ATPase subunit YejF